MTFGKLQVGFLYHHQFKIVLVEGGAILDPDDPIEDVLDDNDFVSIVLETDRPHPSLEEAEVRFVTSQVPGGKFEIPDDYLSLDGCSLSIDDLGIFYQMFYHAYCQARVPGLADLMVRNVRVKLKSNRESLKGTRDDAIIQIHPPQQLLKTDCIISMSLNLDYLVLQTPVYQDTPV